MDETAPNLHSSLAGPTFAVRGDRLDRETTSTRFCHTSAESLRARPFILTTDAYSSLRVDIPGDCVGARC